MNIGTQVNRARLEKGREFEATCARSRREGLGACVRCAGRDAGCQARVTLRGAAIAGWGLAGCAVLLGRAVWSLRPAVENAASFEGLGAPHWALAVAWVGAMAYFMGYRGLQRGLARRVVARAAHLARHPRATHAVLAPLFCLGLIGASRPRLLKSWALVASMASLVFLVRLLPQPYRGLVDAGVIAGLAWGIAAMAHFGRRALGGRPPATELDLPDAGREIVARMEAA